MMSIINKFNTKSMEQDEMELIGHVKIRTNSSSPITCVKLKPDTPFCFISQDRYVKLYNVRDTINKGRSIDDDTAAGVGLKPIIQYDSISNKPIRSLELLQLDKLITCSNMIQIYDITQSHTIRYFNPISKTFLINDCKVLSEDLISIVDNFGTVSIYDLRQSNNFKPIQQFHDAKDVLNSMDFKRDTLSCGCNDGKLYTYDLRMKLCNIDEINPGINNPITKVKFQQRRGTSDGYKLLINSLDESIKLYDLIDRRIVNKFDKTPNDLQFKIGCDFYNESDDDGDNNYSIITGSENGVVYYYNANNNECGESRYTRHRYELYDEKTVIPSVDVDKQRVIWGTSEGYLDFAERIGISP